MPAYVLAETTPRDPDAYAAYRAAASKSVAAHGGRYLVRGGPVECVEGEWPEGQSVVVIEFPSADAVRAWYASEEYAAALVHRDRAVDRRLVFLDGYEPG